MEKLFKGYAQLVDGRFVEFEFEVEKFKNYLTSLHNKEFYYVNLGDSHVSKAHLVYVKFTEAPSVEELIENN